MDVADPQFTREFLKPHLGKRITVEGRVQKWGSFWDGRMRTQVPSVCLQDVDTIENGKLRWSLADHVWIAYSSPVDEVGAQVGDVVRADVLVYEYPWADRDRQPNAPPIVRHGLRDPVDVELVRRMGPARPRRLPKHDVPAVPAPPPMANGNAPEPAVAVLEPPPEPAPAPAPRPGRALLISVLETVDEFGYAAIGTVLKLIRDHGVDAVERAVESVRQLEQ